MRLGAGVSQEEDGVCREADSHITENPEVQSLNYHHQIITNVRVDAFRLDFSTENIL